MADRANSFPIDDTRDKGDNGAGGTAGTHEGHADPVPIAVPLGLGMGSGPQSAGNAAAQQSMSEAKDSGRAYPPGSGSRPPPVAQ